MVMRVTDASSNRQNKIWNAAKVIGRSAIKQAVFEAICSGTKIKTPADVQHKKPHLDEMQIRKAAIALFHEDIIEQTKVKGRIAYVRKGFYTQNREEILRLARDSRKMKAYPTSFNPSGGASAERTVRISLVAKRIRARRITIDDADSFRRVKHVPHEGFLGPYPEAKFKNGLKNLLGEKTSFKDWGGETDDLFTTHLELGGVRRAAAFALKGQATKGKLTLRKMGTNANQIPHLLRAPADVYFVQYCGEVDPDILSELKTHAEMKSYYEDRPIYYGVIDGQDSLRLKRAYASQFR